MDIRLINGSYKSFTEFEWLNIPMFAVVTGPNGSGKTQMLELIARAMGLQFEPEGVEFRRMGHGPLPPFGGKVEINPHLSPQDVVFLRSAWPAPGGSATLRFLNEQIEKAWNEKTLPHHGGEWDRLWSIIEARLGKQRTEIDRDEFVLVLPPNFTLLADQVFRTNGIPALFISYLHSMDFLQRKGHTEKEIEKELTPFPWDILNNVLASAGLPYRVVAPTLPTCERFQETQSDYTLVVEDIATRRRIAPTDLSSGERVMFQAALWFFSFSQQREMNKLGGTKRLLLLDEPDAHLHPALTKAFLHVIHSELVERHEIRVIMTTHAPSTVALAPESSVFVMQREAPRIRRATNWEAAGQLTAGFVTIGSGSKCVFVEDKDDRDFYSTLQTMLIAPSSGLPVLDPSRSILFISADTAHPGEGKGKPSGGKENVKKWVKRISSTQIAGIIDRDTGNVAGDRIYVLERYDHEAYLVDPLFVYAVLLENKKAPPVPDVTLTVHEARGILHKDPTVLQKVVNTMLAEMRSAFINPPLVTDQVPVRYHNGPELLLERWFIDGSGRQFLVSLKKFGLPFHDLQFLRNQYHRLEIIPAELVAILQKIQAA